MIAATLTLSLVASPVPVDDIGAIVLAEGDVLSNGWTVDLIRRASIDDSGDWVALVGTTEPGSGPDDAIVGPGRQVLVAEGDTLPTGSVAEQLIDVAVDAGGLVAVLANVESPVSATQSELIVGGQLVTRTGLGGFGGLAPSGSRIFTMSDVEFAFPYLFVRAKLKTNAGLPYEAFLRVELPPSGAPIIDVVAFEGGALPGAPGVNGSVFFPAALAADGTYLATLTQDVSGSNDATVGLRDGTAVFVEGDAGPIPGTTWLHQTSPAVAKAPGSSFAFSSTLRNASGGIDGVVIGNNLILAYEGQSVLGNPALTVGSFSEAAVAQSSDGTTFFKLPTTTGSVVMAFDEVLAEAPGDTASGAALASTKVGSGATFDVTGDGQQLLTEVELVGGVSALVLIERSVGQGIPCFANPNSTGVPGKLRGIGQSFVAANDLTLVAYDLPQNVFGLLGVSMTPTFVPNPGGSGGNLCLGGQVGRYDAQIGLSGTAGEIATVIDLTMIPRPTTFAAGVAGETWGFQLWHRDIDPQGAQSSNFTGALAVTLR